MQEKAWGHVCLSTQFLWYKHSLWLILDCQHELKVELRRNLEKQTIV